MIYANGRTVVNGRVVPNGPPVVCSSSRTDSRPICRSNSFPILFSASFDTWNVCRRVRGDVATLQNLKIFKSISAFWATLKWMFQNVPEMTFICILLIIRPLEGRSCGRSKFFHGKKKKLNDKPRRRFCRWRSWRWWWWRSSASWWWWWRHINEVKSRLVASILVF